MKVSPEHKEALVNIGAWEHYVKLDPCDCAKAIVKYYQTHLQPHFVAEEKELRPLLEYPYYRNTVWKILKEHNEIADMVRFIEKNCKEPQVGAMIHKLCRSLRSHISYEESCGAFSNASGNTIIELEKSQAGRLWSIFAVSPFLLYLAYTGKMNVWQRVALFVVGTGTLLTVSKAYFENEKRLKKYEKAV